MLSGVLGENTSWVLDKFAIKHVHVTKEVDRYMFAKDEHKRLHCHTIFSCMVCFVQVGNASVLTV